MLTSSCSKSVNSGSQRQSGPPSFLDVYREQCQKFYVCPRRTVISKILRDGSLDICTDVIRADDWKPLLEALRLDRSLTKIKFVSSFLVDYPAIIADVSRLQLVRKVQKDFHIPSLLAPEVFEVFCSSLCEHVKANRALKTLTLQGFPFSIINIQHISTAIRESKSLDNLSFEGCPLGQQRLEAICHGLRGSHSPRVLTLSSCQINGTSVEALASLLQLQVIQLHGEAWQEGLRKRPLALDAFGGLRRLTLCNNPLGDGGVAVLLAALRDDLWLRALDLQNCGIGNAGAAAVLSFLTENHTLDVVDLRRNPNIDSALIKAISDKLQENCRGRRCKFKLLPLGKTSLMPSSPCRMRSRSAGSCSRGLKHSKKKQLRSQSVDQKKHAWPLSSAPVDEHKSKHNPVCFPKPQLKQCLPASFFIDVTELQKQLLLCQESLKREQEMRIHAEKLLLEMFEENRKLRVENESLKPDGYTLAECALLEAVEDTFVKFYEFLEIRKKNRPATQLQHKALPLRPETHRASIIKHPVDVKMPGKQLVPSCQTGLTAMAANGIKPLQTAENHKRALLDQGLLQDLISSKAQKLVAELRASWSKSRNVSRIVTEDVNARHLSREKQSEARNLDFSVRGGSNTASPSNKGGKRSVSEMSPSTSECSFVSPQNEGDVPTFEEDSRRLSELLDVGHVPSKLVPSTDASKDFYPLENDVAADYAFDDFESTVLSASSESGSKKHSFSKEKSKEVHSLLLSGASDSRRTLQETSSSKLCTTSSNRTDNMRMSSKAAKTSQTTSMLSSLNEEVASGDTMSSLHQQQIAAKAVPITVPSSETVTAGTQEVSFPVRQAILLSATPSVSLSQGASKSFEITTADITVSSIGSHSKYAKDWSGKCQVARAQVAGSKSREGGNTPRELDAMHTPSDVTLSRNHSSISTPSSPDTPTSPRLVGSDFDGF